VEELVPSLVKVSSPTNTDQQQEGEIKTVNVENSQESAPEANGEAVRRVKRRGLKNAYREKKTITGEDRHTFVTHSNKLKGRKPYQERETTRVLKRKSVPTEEAKVMRRRS